MTQFNFPLALYALILDRPEPEQRWLFDFAAMYGLGKMPEGFDLLTDTERKIMAIIDRANPGRKYTEEIASIVTHLNEVCGTAFRANTPDTAKHLSARLAEGYTVEEIKAVIDLKAAAWKSDPRMAGYLRPKTLFGSNFESYHSEVKAAGARSGAAGKCAAGKQVGSFDTDDFFQLALRRTAAAMAEAKG